MASPGELVGDRFRLDGTIGRGTSATVWKAWDLRLSLTVALKQLPSPDVASPEIDAVREATIAASLRHHPNVLSTYDLLLDGGSTWLVMEYLAGRTLEAAIAYGPMAVDRVARFGAQLADAIAAGHELGIVHCDVKPGNVMLDRDDRVKLADFGIARLHRRNDGTGGRPAGGTVAYLAPEVARGAPHGPESDLFSLGATLFAAVEGVPPFGRDPDRGRLLRVVRSGITAHAERAGPLGPVLHRLLQIDPATRPDAATARLMLQRVAGPGSDAPPVTRPAGGQEPRQRRMWNVPARNVRFRGREDVLGRTRDVLADGRTSACVLYGPGGVGKSSLAVEYAHRFHGEYDTVWWVTAEKPELVPEQLGELARGLELVGPQANTVSAVSQLAGWLQDRGRWLVVFDNVEDPAALARHLFGGSGHVLVTSRNPDWQEIADRVAVDVFTRPEAVGLLRTHVPGLTEPDADAIADAVGDLPLALTQAGAYLDETDTATDEYLRLLDTRTAEVLDQIVPVGYPATFTAAHRMTVDRLRAADPAAYTLLRLTAYLAPEPIPATLFTAAPDLLPSEMREPARDRLGLASLTRSLRRWSVARVDRGHVQVHRLTQAVLRHDEADRTDATELRRSVLGSLDRTLPEQDSWNNPATWPAWRALLAHVVAACGTAGPDPATALLVAGLLNRVVRFLIAVGDAKQALPFAERASDLLAEHADPGDPRTEFAMQNQATTLWMLGDFTEAHRLDSENLALRRARLGDDAQPTIDSAFNLAEDLLCLRRVDEAYALGREICERQRALSGPDDPLVWDTEDAIVKCLLALGRADEALPEVERIVRARTATDGPDHPRTMISTDELAQALRAVGHVDRARTIDEENLERRRRVIGGDHPETLESAHGLARDLELLGRRDDAARLDRDTYRRRVVVLGENHPDTLDSARRVGATGAG